MHTLSGGITTLAFDGDALDEYLRATESNANLDEFMARMTRGDIIPSDVRLRCILEVTHVRNSTQVGEHTLNHSLPLSPSDLPPYNIYMYYTTVILSDPLLFICRLTLKSR